MKCFVACAFGKKDVDDTYKIIKGVLNSLGITALRVDKIVHNEKIDKKILDSIVKCDFGIADLTYARQSVYYEAGYLHGLGKEVLFTCKNDHFNSTIDQSRIHFDLITHNVLGWKSSPKTFSKELKARITQIILPLRKAQVEKQRVVEEEREFSQLSLVQKFTMIRKGVTEVVKQAKYDVLDLGKYESTFFGARNAKKNKDDIIFGFIDRTFTSRQIRELWTHKIPAVTGGINRGFTDITIKLDPLYTTIIIASLLRITDSTIQQALWNSTKLQGPEKIYNLMRNDKTERFIFIDSIKSLSEFKERLASVLS